MTEIAEAISVANISHEDHDEETCAFCTRPAEPTDEENDLVDKQDMEPVEASGLEDAGIAHKNKSDVLGSNVEANKETQIETVVNVAGIGQTLPVQSAAHHLIPGNASLKPKGKPPSKIMKYLHTDGMATGNIGYNVNNHENGVWLVGNYAIRKAKGLVNWGSKGSGFRKKYGVDPYEYAKAAITQSGRQFHDGHDEYSTFVKDTLDLVAKKMKKTGDVWCQENKDARPSDPKKLQLTMLVNRLNTISRRMESMLKNPGRNWKTNIFTSRFSERYIKEEIYGKKK